MTAGDGTTGLTKAKVLQAFEQLGTNDVPDDGQRFAVIGWRQWSDLLDLQEFASAEFVGDDQLPWRGMQAKRWLGTTWLPHSGLPLVSGRAYLLLVPQERRRPCHRPGGDHRHHLARRPRGALRRQLDVAGRRADRRRRRHPAALPGGLSMAYQSKDLSALGYANGFTLWHYRTSDLAAVVDNGGYFNAASRMVRVGDFILLNAGIGDHADARRGRRGRQRRRRRST